MRREYFVVDIDPPESECTKSKKRKSDDSPSTEDDSVQVLGELIDFKYEKDKKKKKNSKDGGNTEKHGRKVPRSSPFDLNNIDLNKSIEENDEIHVVDYIPDDEPQMSPKQRRTPKVINRGRSDRSEKEVEVGNPYIKRLCGDHTNNSTFKEKVVIDLDESSEMERDYFSESEILDDAETDTNGKPEPSPPNDSYLYDNHLLFSTSREPSPPAPKTKFADTETCSSDEIRVLSPKENWKPKFSKVSSSSSFKKLQDESYFPDPLRVCFIEERNAYLSLHELRTLLPNNWLCDSVIDAFFCVLQRQLPKSVLVISSYWSNRMNEKGHIGVEKFRETKDLITVITSASSKTILIPVNLNKHWVLCVIYPESRNWGILDSTGNITITETADFYMNMLMWLTYLTKDDVQTNGDYIALLNSWEFKFPITKKNAHQVYTEDTDNCGVYVCLYAQEISFLKNLDAVVRDNLRQEVNQFRGSILELLLDTYKK